MNTLSTACYKHAVILAHPEAQSFNASVARAYCDAVAAKGQVAEMRDLYRIGFDPRLTAEERPGSPSFRPRDDVATELDAIADADVFVFVYPIWFGMPPAMIVGYVDRVLGAGFGHRKVKARARHAFMSGKHLLSITTSGTSIQWLDEQGAYLSLRDVFDGYLAHAFSMVSNEHLHLSNIVDGMEERYAREELQLVTEMANATCGRIERVHPARAA